MAPFLLLSLATVLMLMSPLKNLVVNVCMASFRANGYDATIGRVLDIAYKPVFGAWPMQAYTSLGYALMMVATGMQVNIVGKVQATMSQAMAKCGSKPSACAGGE